VLLNLIRIRVFQLGRELKNVGLFRAILLVIAFISFLFVAEGFINSVSSLINIFLVFLLLIVIIHLKRRDKSFIAILSEHQYRIFYIEYVILLSPIIAIVFFHHWILTILFLLLLFPVAFINIHPSKGTAYNFFLQFVPIGLFEWKSGFRKTFIIIFLLYIFSLAFAFSIGVLPVAFFLITAIIISFYSMNEPRYMIELHELPAKQFLFKKLKQNLQLYTLFMLPLMVAMFIFYQQQWFLIVALVFMCYNLLVFSILSKYAHYEPAVSSSFHGLLTGLALAGTLLPPFAIVVLIMNLKFYKKAIQNLSPYLNDYH
jgi:hypothetical protein